MSLQFTVVAGPDRGRSFQLNPGKTVFIGRATESIIPLSDLAISRQHCQLKADENETSVTLTDLGSSSGTWLNDERVNKNGVVASDTIRIGDTSILVERQPADSDATVPPQSPEIESPTRAPGLIEGLVGRQIHNYLVQEVLATGTSGIVFRAVDERNNEPLAVKVLWPQITRDSDEQRRFVRGMKAMFPIRHPNLVRIFNAGIQDVQQLGVRLCWVAMEFVDGYSLQSIIEKTGTAGMLDWQRALRIAVDIARALEAAFDHDVVHRNVTPDNILVDRHKDTAKLSDLMLARALEGAGAEQITQRGQLVGDLIYMAPERTRGEEASHLSDMYSLGATLYSVVSGRPPFQAEHVPDLVSAIQNDDPGPPSEIQMAVNPLFDTIILKMLAKQPADRFENFSKLLNELERVAKFARMTI